MVHHQLNERCLELAARVVVVGQEGEEGGEVEYFGRSHAHSRGRSPQLVHQHLKGRFHFVFVMARFLHLDPLTAILRARREGCQVNSTALRPRHPERVTYALSMGWMKYEFWLPASVSRTT